MPVYVRKGFGIGKAVVWSAFIHFLLSILMFRVSVHLSVEPPRFVEVMLGQMAQMPYVAPEGGAEGEPFTAGAKTPSDRVEVPERMMLEIEEPTITVPKKELYRDVGVSTGEKIFTVPRRERRVLRSAPSLAELRKKAPVVRGTDLGFVPGVGVETRDVGEEAKVAFIIKGDIKTREIIENPLPEYPSGLQKEAIVKLFFSVLPNGDVGDIRLVQKGETRLENEAISKLKQWRFNPLPEGDETIQTGEITFIFKLR